MCWDHVFSSRTVQWYFDTATARSIHTDTVTANGVETLLSHSIILSTSGRVYSAYNNVNWSIRIYCIWWCTEPPNATKFRRAQSIKYDTRGRPSKIVVVAVLGNAKEKRVRSGARGKRILRKRTFRSLWWMTLLRTPRAHIGRARPAPEQCEILVLSSAPLFIYYYLFFWQTFLALIYLYTVPFRFTYTAPDYVVPRPPAAT